ncbi:MAG: MFS transporter [Halopseudomonas sp.]|uniref:MFS transporter n=1 Tax=Halopseudomonas sp. TaxID=2901191 RepID=UPI003002262E
MNSAEGLDTPTEMKAYLSTATLLLMATATGLCAGANYFNQPLLHSIAQSLSISEGLAATTVTLSQVAYALGLLFLVPLGDKLEQRGLAVGLMLLATAGLLISGYAHNFNMLVIGTLITGLFSVAAQILVPMAANLSDPARSGRAVGLVMSGLLAGILLARAAAGLLSEVAGWASIYRLTALLMLLLAALLWTLLPRSRNPEPASYAATLRSLASLSAAHPRLRSRALLGGLVFGSVSVLFSSMALLLSGPAYGLNDSQIGLVGLLGISGVITASLVGRLADLGHGQSISCAAIVLLLLGWLGFYLGTGNLWWFLLPMLLLDIALPAVHISNQSVIYQLAPHARARVNAVYMTGYFIGAASGSALGAAAWSLGGWSATCATGLALATLAALALWYDQQLVQREARHA